MLLYSSTQVHSLEGNILLVGYLTDSWNLVVAFQIKMQNLNLCMFQIKVNKK